MNIDKQYALSISLAADRLMVASLMPTNMKRTALHYSRKAQAARRQLAGGVA